MCSLQVVAEESWRWLCCVRTLAVVRVLLLSRLEFGLLDVKKARMISKTIQMMAILLSS